MKRGREAIEEIGIIIPPGGCTFAPRPHATSRESAARRRNRTALLAHSKKLCPVSPDAPAVPTETGTQ